MSDFSAEDARQLRDNPVRREIMANIREGIITQLEILPPDRDRMRDELVISLQVLRAIEQQIQSYIDTEVLEDAE